PSRWYARAAARAALRAPAGSVSRGEVRDRCNAMRAIAVNEWRGRERMELLEVEPPPVAPDGVLVRVRAAGLNPVDYKVREGKLAGAFPHHFPGTLRWGPR